MKRAAAATTSLLLLASSSGAFAFVQSTGGGRHYPSAATTASTTSTSSTPALSCSAATARGRRRDLVQGGGGGHQLQGRREKAVKVSVLAIIAGWGVPCYRGERLLGVPDEPDIPHTLPWRTYACLISQRPDTAGGRGMVMIVRGDGVTSRMPSRSASGVCSD